MQDLAGVSTWRHSTGQYNDTLQRQLPREARESFEGRMAWRSDDMRHGTDWESRRPRCRVNSMLFQLRRRSDDARNLSCRGWTSWPS